MDQQIPTTCSKADAPDFELGPELENEPTNSAGQITLPIKGMNCAGCFISN